MTKHRAHIDQDHLDREQSHPATSRASYHIDLPADILDDQGSLLDSLIRFMLDTLNVQHLDLRIVAEARSLVSHESSRI